MPRPFALGLMAVLLPGLAAAQLPPSPWKEERSQAQIWSITARSKGLDRVVISCLNRADYEAEIMIEVVVGSSSSLASAQEAQAAPQGVDKAVTLTSVFRSEQSGNVLRWSGFRRAGFEAAYGLAEGLDTSGVLRVATPTGAAETFGAESAMAKPSATVLRCSPSVVSLRARLAGMRDTSALITLYSDANSRCRGGSGDERETWVSCGERTEISERLDRLGQCYGRQGQSGAEMRWHRCGPGSIRTGSAS